MPREPRSRQPGPCGARGPEPALWLPCVRALGRGRWPARIWAAMGDSEYKSDGSQVFSQTLVRYLDKLSRTLQAQVRALAVSVCVRVRAQVGA